MRKTRLTALSSLAVLLVLPSLASANCYSIYDAKNRLAFQSTIAPVDLSTRISDGMRARFPGGHLVMVPDDSDCREYRTGPTLSPRFEAGNAAGTEARPDRDARGVAAPARHRREPRPDDTRGRAQRQRPQRQAPLSGGGCALSAAAGDPRSSRQRRSIASSDPRQTPAY